MTIPNNGGYKKPPKKHQWQPGQSGNPSGKKKAAEGKNLTLLEILAVHLDEQIELTSKGKKQKMQMSKALALKFYHDLMSAPLKQKCEALKILKALGVFDLQKMLTEVTEDWEDPFTEEDRRILAIINGAADPDE